MNLYVSFFGKILQSAWSSLKDKVKLFLIFFRGNLPMSINSGRRKFLRLDKRRVLQFPYWVTTEFPSASRTYVLDVLWIPSYRRLQLGHCSDMYVWNHSIQIEVRKSRIWTSKFFLSQGCWPIRAGGCRWGVFSKRIRVAAWIM